MKLTISAAAVLFATPLLATSAFSMEPTKEPETKVMPAAPAEEKDGETSKPEAKEAERVCRYIRADASSRRKSKVCMTTEEWREFNNRR